MHNNNDDPYSLRTDSHSRRLLAKERIHRVLRINAFQNWNAALIAFQHQQATLKEIEKLMHTFKRPKKSTKQKPSRPQHDAQLKSEIAKINKALEPE